MNTELLKSVESFQAQTGLSDHRVGIILARNGRLLERLRAGGRFWPETQRQIERAIGREQAARAARKKQADAK